MFEEKFNLKNDEEILQINSPKRSIQRPYIIKEKKHNMKKALIIIMLAVVGSSIGCTQKPRELTHKEKADIQYQLFLMSEKATHKAVKVKYEYGTDIVEDILLKDSYKDLCKQFEGVTAPSDDVDLVDFISYRMRINDTTKITINFDTQGNSYTITSKYDFNTHKFDRTNDIFMYMCLTREDAEEYEGKVINGWAWNLQLANIYDYNGVKEGGEYE
ncbi:MAG: hypothetical protein LBC68_11335 [Prevotellaceae bacterium]|jgi:hypothetical protein|nr:hypothetical protein [Prevotellaceae bacterium]